MLKICSDFLQTLVCKVEYLLNVLFCEHFFICMVTIIQNLQFFFLPDFFHLFLKAKKSASTQKQANADSFFLLSSFILPEK